MAKTYLDIINDARDEFGGGHITISRLVDDDAEVAKARAAMQKAVRDLFAKNVSIPSENKITSITTTISQSLLTNLVSNPWDAKMVREIHYYDSAENVRRRLIPLSATKAEDFKLLTFQEKYPQYYYQSGNDIYVLPIPDAVYTLQLRYSKAIPLLGVSDLTTQLDADNEGILILTDLVYAYLVKGQDPEWEKHLSLARTNAELYYDRLNFGLKNQGVTSIMRVRTNPADLNY